MQLAGLQTHVGRRRLEPVHDDEGRLGVVLVLRPVVLVSGILQRERVEAEAVAEEGQVLGVGRQIDEERPGGRGGGPPPWGGGGRGGGGGGRAGCGGGGEKGRRGGAPGAPGTHSSRPP